MKTEKEIREKIASLKNSIPTQRRNMGEAMIEGMLKNQIITLEWVLNER